MSIKEIGSFNPCYSGIGFRSIWFKLCQFTIRSFNPCYSGIGFRSERLYTIAIKICVSILVILELALEVQTLFDTMKGAVGFNPCYSGIGFRSRYKLVH